ncbi:hypothetical protein NL676_004558 [Syzygium grande]|nr:hypothetical protein NL676_004558 [Syzygium grande]
MVDRFFRVPRSTSNLRSQPWQIGFFQSSSSFTMIVTNSPAANLALTNLAYVGIPSSFLSHILFSRVTFFDLPSYFLFFATIVDPNAI